jgi:hypothetical protein
MKHAKLLKEQLGGNRTKIEPKPDKPLISGTLLDMTKGLDTIELRNNGVQNEYNKSERKLISSFKTSDEIFHANQKANSIVENLKNRKYKKLFRKIENIERTVLYHKQNTIELLNMLPESDCETIEKSLKSILEKCLNTTILQQNVTLVFSAKFYSDSERIPTGKLWLFLNTKNSLNTEDSLKFVCCYDDVPSFPTRFRKPARVAILRRDSTNTVKFKEFLIDNKESPSYPNDKDFNKIARRLIENCTHKGSTVSWNSICKVTDVAKEECHYLVASLQAMVALVINNLDNSMYQITFKHIYEILYNKTTHQKIAEISVSKFKEGIATAASAITPRQDASTDTPATDADTLPKTGAETDIQETITLVSYKSNTYEQTWWS